MRRVPHNHLRRSLLGAVVASVITLLGAVQARADAVKLSGAWIDDVSVQNVADGQIVYVNNAGTEVYRPIAVLQGLRLNSFPDLAVAQAAIDGGKDAAALESLGKVLGAARQPWLRHWTMRLMIGALDRLGKPAEAVDMTLMLLREKPQPALIPDPLPIASLNTAAPAKRDELIKRVQQAIPSLDESGAAAAKKLVAAVTPTTPDAGGPAPTADAHGSTPTATPAAGRPDSPRSAAHGAEAVSAVVLPHPFKGSTDEVTLMLQRGEFESALAKVNEILSKPTGEMATRLFQRGIAQENIADKTHSLDGYKDAGLSFMSVVVYFPGNASFVGPALVEVAYIHHQIGDNETASKLLTKAALTINDDAEPAYVKRIDAIRKMLVAPTAAPAGTPTAEQNPPE